MYKVGDKVRIKSLNWYNENKDKDGEIVCGEFVFLENMKKFCSKTLTILEDVDDGYLMLEDDLGYVWTDEMIEELVEEETKLKHEDEINGEYYSTPKYLVKPSGYQFKDENDTVIYAQKAVLEKKKKEYPKTYKECCKILGFDTQFCMKYLPHGTFSYKDTIIYNLQELLICRDAYWKLCGDEMGLKKPWEPDWSTEYERKYVIEVYRNNVRTNSYGYSNTTLAFPTPEMRDTFYENFKKEIEECKELL